MKREVGTAEHFEEMLALFESKTRATQKFVFLQYNDLKHGAKNMKKLLTDRHVQSTAKQMVPRKLFTCSFRSFILYFSRSELPIKTYGYVIMSK